MTRAQELPSDMLHPSPLQHLVMGNAWAIAFSPRDLAALQMLDTWMLLATQALGMALYG